MILVTGCLGNSDAVEAVIDTATLPVIAVRDSAGSWTVAAEIARGPAFVGDSLVYSSEGMIWMLDRNATEPRAVARGLFASGHEDTLAVVSESNLTLIRAGAAVAVFEFPAECEPDHKPAVISDAVAVGLQCGRADVAGGHPRRQVEMYRGTAVDSFPGWSPWSDGEDIYFIADAGLMVAGADGPSLWKRIDADAADSAGGKLVIARTNAFCSSSRVTEDGRTLLRLSDRFVEDVEISASGSLALGIIGGPTRSCEWF